MGQQAAGTLLLAEDRAPKLDLPPQRAGLEPEGSINPQNVALGAVCSRKRRAEERGLVMMMKNHSRSDTSQSWGHLSAVSAAGFHLVILSLHALLRQEKFPVSLCASLHPQPSPTPSPAQKPSTGANLTKTGPGFPGAQNPALEVKNSQGNITKDQMERTSLPPAPFPVLPRQFPSPSSCSRQRFQLTAASAPLVLLPPRTRQGSAGSLQLSGELRAL